MRFLLPCPLCLGRRRIGLGSSPRPCPTCTGSGEIAKSAADLTPAEAAALRRELAPIPPDPDGQYILESTRENITRTLSSHYIHTVTFPEDGAATFDLLDRRGRALRVFPEFRHGRFHNLNTIPVPPETPP